MPGRPAFKCRCIQSSLQEQLRPQAGWYEFWRDYVKPWLSLMLLCYSSLRHLKCTVQKQALCIRELRRYHSSVVQELQARGLLHSLTTSPKELEGFFKSSRTIYCGFDPTAGSLHLGNLVPLITLLHFHLKGHQVIALLGGATGLVGDPSGRDTERPLQPREVVHNNTKKLQEQLRGFFRNSQEYAAKRLPHITETLKAAKLLNNLHWWEDMKLLEFLQCSGKHIRLSSMLSKESVKNRMQSTNGISFSEFSYQLLQAHDFWHLYKHFNCTTQIGGSDQWGNIVAGLDLINRQESQDDAAKAFGLTTPLLITSSGQKFGKSAGNAVWLDHTKTSVFDFYQFCLRTTDEDVEKYLKIFSLLSEEDIANIVAEHSRHPELRFAQHRLASEITEMVHGVNAVSQAQAATRLLFGIDLHQIQPEEAEEALRYDPRYRVMQEEELVNIPLSKLAVIAGLTESRADAIRLINSGGLYLNNVAISDKNRKLVRSDLLCERLVILRKGKDSHVVLALKH